MTENEAIKVMESYSEEEYGKGLVAESHKMAIQALEEIQQYRAIGTVEEFKALKEKNEPKKVEYDIYGEEENYPYCECGSCLEFQLVRAKHCPRCGQKLDWERKE